MATKVWLSIEYLEPLLRNDLTVAETMLSRFQIAVTLVHETVVGTGIRRSVTRLL